MNLVQINLAQMSITAGIMIIGIVVFRSLFVHRVPKRFMAILWGIVVLRLLLPCCLSFSMPGIGTLVTGYVPSSGYTFEAVTVTATNFGVGNTENMFYAVKMPAAVDWGKVLTVIYLMGAAVMGVGSVYLYLRDGRLFRESLPMGKKEKEHLIRLTGAGEKEWRRLEKADFRISDRTATPVTYGIFRPAIVFPKGIFLKEEKEVGFCLMHELVHIGNHDNLKKMIVHVALCIHWFNPLVWVMYSLFNRDIELLCDETAVRMGMADRQDYALAMLSLAERRAEGFRTALGFGKNAVKERILAVMTAGKTKISGVMAAIFALIFALTAFFASQTFVAVAYAGEYSGAADTAEYIVTADEDVTVSYGDSVTEYTVVTADKTDAPIIQVNVTADETEDAAEVSADAAASADAVASADITYADVETAQVQAVAEDDGMPETLVMSLQNLASEFEDYGLQIQIKSDDYQLYFDGKPVYFLIDNRNQDGDGFTGRVYAREAGNGNGNTGVATKRDENGVIVGLVNLSEKESRDVARSWTGR